MKSTQPTAAGRRHALAAALLPLALLAALSGCDRRSTDVPAPTTSTTPSATSTLPGPAASAASQ